MLPPFHGYLFYFIYPQVYACGPTGRIVMVIDTRGLKPGATFTYPYGVKMNKKEEPVPG